MKRIIAIIITGVILSSLFLTGCGKDDEYNEAMQLYKSKQYQKAADKFLELGDFENSEKMVKVCNYELAKTLFDKGSYNDALTIFKDLGDYKESTAYSEKCSRQIMFVEYKDVFAALNGKTYYFNGGSDTKLNRIVFSDKTASLSTATFDGNGKTESEIGEFDFNVDNNYISLISFDNSDLKIKYTLSGKKIKLDKKEYFSPKEVDKAIQGCWKSRESTSASFLNYIIYSEHNIRFKKGKIVVENATTSTRSDRVDGQYFYYGPYSGKYSIDFGGFKTKAENGDEWFYNIIDGKVKVLHYYHVAKKCKKLPGKGGYHF